MRNYLLTLLLALVQTALAQTADLKQLYQQLDQAIEQSPQYVAKLESRIAQAREAYQQETSPEKRLVLADQLFLMYRAYDNDSALHYIAQYVDLADALGRKQQADQGRAMMAFQCSTVGLYTESLGILHAIDSRSLSREGQCDYFAACMHVCGELSYYTRLESMRQYYQRLQREYRDSFYTVADPQSEEYLLRRETQLLSEKRFADALKLNDQRLAKAKPDTRDYAIVSYYRYLIFGAQQKEQEARYWLAQSALCDVKNAVMDQASLISLAELLNQDGDFDRSYRYIRFTWDCNNRFNTRMRSWQISPILTVIENNYQNELRHNSRMLTGGIVLVSVLALLLMGALFYSLRERKRLAEARSKLQSSNDQLTQLNSRLETQTRELSQLNEQLSSLNSQLSEANRVKEEYIGRFMSLCSEYIGKLDDFRKLVNRKMKNKELDELFRLSKSTELKEKELEELYENFDSVFLHLFPNFVADFNALLQPEVQIHPKDGQRLTTDLRIFALIRLGIEDSSKIAEFLHYSVNTIYNYRARTKNGAIGNRENFEREVKKLGLPG